MTVVDEIKSSVVKGVEDLYGIKVDPEKVITSLTRKEFTGDYTVVVFPFSKMAKKKPDEVGVEMGKYLVDNIDQINDSNVIKGFLNLSLSDTYWKNFLFNIANDSKYGKFDKNGKTVLVEFSSPNTNKPLHLGHIRNILLGWSAAKILEAAGYDAKKVQIVNDRGIAICKSMVAWQLFGEGATPASTNTKGDHFIGKYYVQFETAFKEEYKTWQNSADLPALPFEHDPEKMTEDEFWKKHKNWYFNNHSKLGASAKEMLLKWEANDEATRSLWKQMNGWVYEGFDETYEKLGVNFDKLYFESDTYILGKDIIEEGLKKNIFYRKEDSSVWIDLEDAKLDHKLVLRSDGTSVYMTQDIGTANVRHQDYGMDKMVYVVADEQDYHFKVLFEIMKRMGAPYADGLFHLSYGMVDLPTGKMKSREGTVIDADDLVKEVIEEARLKCLELGEVGNLPIDQQQEIFYKVGMSALKYFIVKVNPKKRMVFDPKESVDFQGQTGPYIQYAFVRTNGVGNTAKKDEVNLEDAKAYKGLEPSERELILQLSEYPHLVQLAAKELDPSIIAAYCYNIAKLYSKFWNDCKIFGLDKETVAFRVLLSQQVGTILKSGMELLGIEMPEQM